MHDLALAQQQQIMSISAGAAELRTNLNKERRLSGKLRFDLQSLRDNAELQKVKDEEVISRNTSSTNIDQQSIIQRANKKEQAIKRKIKQSRGKCTAVQKCVDSAFSTLHAFCNDIKTLEELHTFDIDSILDEIAIQCETIVKKLHEVTNVVKNSHDNLKHELDTTKKQFISESSRTMLDDDDVSDLSDCEDQNNFISARYAASQRKSSKYRTHNPRRLDMTATDIMVHCNQYTYKTHPKPPQIYHKCQELIHDGYKTGHRGYQTFILHDMSEFKVFHIPQQLSISKHCSRCYPAIQNMYYITTNGSINEKRIGYKEGAKMWEPEVPGDIITQCNKYLQRCRQITGFIRDEISIYVIGFFNNEQDVYDEIQARQTITIDTNVMMYCPECMYPYTVSMDRPTPESRYKSQKQPYIANWGCVSRPLLSQAMNHLEELGLSAEHLKKMGMDAKRELSNSHGPSSQREQEWFDPHDSSPRPREYYSHGPSQRSREQEWFDPHDSSPRPREHDHYPHDPSLQSSRKHYPRGPSQQSREHYPPGPSQQPREHYPRGPR